MTRELLIPLIVAPVLEELIFRAGLLDMLDRRYPRWRGLPWNLVVSLLFGLLHLWQWPAIQAAWVILPSLILGRIWQRWRNLLVCISVHSLFNATGLLWRLVF